MTKFYIKSLTALVIVFASITSNSQCVVCVDAPALITCGETATLFGDGYLTSVYSDNFNAGLGALWDAISFVIVYVAAILLFLTTFNNTTKCSKNFSIYKLMWLQEMFILSGILGTFLGFIFIFEGMALDAAPGVDPSAALISNFAIAILTILYGVIGATTIYLVQKYYELKNDTMENIEIEKPKEGFLFSSALYFFIFIIIDVFAAYIGSRNTGGAAILFNIEKNIYMITFIIILILFYNGNSFVNLIKNVFFYYPDSEKNIIYNLKFIRNMKNNYLYFIYISCILYVIHFICFFTCMFLFQFICICLFVFHYCVPLLLCY